MSTMNLDPKNMLVLAVVGVGAYWFLTRRAQAGYMPRQQGGGLLPAGSGATAYGTRNQYATQTQQQDPLNPLLATAGRKIADWFNSPSTPQITGPDLTAANPAPDAWPSDDSGSYF